MSLQQVYDSELYSRPPNMPALSRRTSGWLVSILCHGLVVAGLLSIPRPMPSPELPFHWDIVLLDATPPEPATHAPSDSKMDAGHSPASPASMMKRPLEHIPQPVHRTVRSRSSVTPADSAVSRTSHSVVERSVISRVDAVSKGEVVHMSHALTHELAERRTHVASPPAVSREHVEQAPARVIAAAGAIQSSPSAIASGTYSSEAAAPDGHRRPVAETNQPHVQRFIEAKAVNTQPAARPHYGWLKEALKKKILEMKRYPDIAANHRWEGRVVVRGVITDKGVINDLVIAESSGSAVLDEDALALLRRISPLKLEHPLGQSQISIRIPIEYGIQ